MKLVFLMLLMVSFIGIQAQDVTTVTYYNREGEIVDGADAFRYSEVSKVQDHYKKLLKDKKYGTLLSEEHFLDKECKTPDGLYRAFYNNGRRSAIGVYEKGKKAGLWKTWAYNGTLIDSAVYKDGFIYGLNLSWDDNGKLIDSSLFGDGGDGVSHAYWSDGRPRHRGSWVAGKKDGAWVYYHENGMKSQEVNYASDSALSYNCYDKQGKLQTKDCIYEREAMYPGGEKAWIRYLARKLKKKRLQDKYYYGEIYGRMLVQFVVETDGSLSNIEVIQLLDKRLDDAVVSIIKSSRHWKPAIQNNRLVRAYRRQPITVSKREKW